MPTSTVTSGGIATMARAVTFTQYGEVHKVTQMKTVPLRELGPDEVLVKTLVSPINPSDMAQIQGIYPSRPAFTKDFGETDTAIGGNEGLFEVVEVGKDVTSLKAGDWTMPSSVSFGTWRSHSVVNVKGLSPALPIKGLVSPVQVATSNINPVSAYQMLKDYVTLQPGDFFIQNGGNSAVGRAAIQLGKMWGYKSISVVRDRDNLQELVDELKSLGADYVMTEEQSASKEFSETVKEWTKGSEVKLALNCVCGTSATNLARHLSYGGTFVTYGAMAKQGVTLGPDVFIFNDIIARGYWLTLNAKKNPGSRNEALKAVLKLVAEGKLTQVPVLEHNLSADNSDEANTKIARDAFEVYSNGFSGKKHVFVYE